ncbi:FAD-binding oxidoreductase [Actinomadura sp. 9N407]|uniref:FAD-binding oxidoreductase n=1 Tax=Actinomadura sp. 9N407 TaxID=3375154 RepID=UPI0037B626D9
MNKTTNGIGELRSEVRGRVLLPGDEGFDPARRPWNSAIEQPVAAVVEIADADDAANLVRYARNSGLALTAQPNGHGATGDVEGLILVRTGRLDEMEVRPGSRIARVGAGVSWGRVQAAASPHGLTGLPGSSPVVSVVGYTLGGGLSWFGRKHGWASESVRAFEIVDPDGKRARVSADEDPELFWALRGGGGDFALVTAIEFDLHPAPVLYGGRMLWPAERAPEVLAAYQEITATAPGELTAWFDLLNFPGSAPMVAVDATYLGDERQGRTLLRPLERIGGTISDGRGVLPVSDLGAITAEPTDPSPGLSRGELLTGLDEPAGKDLLARTLLDEPIDPLLSVQIRHLGGALAAPSEGAAPALTEPYSLYLFGVPSTPTAAAAIRARQGEITRALAPLISGRKPYTYLSPGESAAAAFAPADLARLQGIKRRRDPAGVICANYPVIS